MLSVFNAECGAFFIVILRAIMLNVIMLNVVAPSEPIPILS
jgi:hypothetical protein